MGLSKKEIITKIRELADDLAADENTYWIAQKILDILDPCKPNKPMQCIQCSSKKITCLFTSYHCENCGYDSSGIKS